MEFMFAEWINEKYLEWRGDPYSLQIMLGHSTMAMVKKYLAIARSDLAHFHRLASPVANWRL
jgi:site-specific recombinase XerD